MSAAVAFLTAFYLPPLPCRLSTFITSAAEARTALIDQVTGAVRWVECLQLLLAESPTHLIEVGPGRVLTGLTRQILGKGIESPISLNVEDSASLDKTLATLTGA